MKGGGEHPSPRTMRDLKRMDVRAPTGIGSTGSLPLCTYIIPNTKEQIPQPETVMGQCYGSDTNSYHENDFRMVHDI